MKYLIFDAGPIISLTMSGLLPVLENLKKNFKGEFIITNAVKKEVIDRPYKNKKYKLESLQVKELLEKGVLKMSSDFIEDGKLMKETNKIMKSSNSVLRTSSNNKKIKIIQEGEATCLAFANLCDEESVIVVDERNTRLLGEAPEKLESLMERKLHIQLDYNSNAFNKTKDYKLIRSSELIYIAFKKNLTSLTKDIDTLDALLYSLKFNGTAISSEEIEQIKNIAKKEII